MSLKVTKEEAIENISYTLEAIKDAITRQIENASTEDFDLIIEAGPARTILVAVEILKDLEDQKMAENHTSKGSQKLQ